MRIRAATVVAIAVLAGLVPACARRHCVPDSLTRQSLVDLDADPNAHAAVDPALTREVEAEFRKKTAALRPAGARPYQFVALSGGGLYGAFGTGVLNGWSEVGSRPEFDVVTGISTGGLMATFVFLGPQYDGFLRENMLGISRGDILRGRSALHLLFADAAFSSRPLARRIDEAVTPAVLAEVAAAHAAGRRLYIGTTNIDTRKLVIWDMGAIAARGTDESLHLYRSIVLASTSIPGAFPPVRIPVEVNGTCYEELHVDGGVSDEVIFRAFMVADLNRIHGLPGTTAPAGSTLVVISNGKLYADPMCVRPRLTNMVAASFRSIVYGKTRDELYRIYLNCLETGVELRLTAVPQDFRLGEAGGLRVSPADQHRLFDIGREIGHSPLVGPHWRDVPPGTDPSEQVLPRSGTRFATP